MNEYVAIDTEGNIILLEDYNGTTFIIGTDGEVGFYQSIKLLTKKLNLEILGKL